VDRGAHALARPLSALRVAVVGGGWSGIAAAVHARCAGHRVTLLEMAPQLGGRARSVVAGGVVLDNGQHIMVGAYQATLALMRRIGADPGTLLQRLPLALTGPDGRGLALARGAPVPAFVRAVLGHRGWSWADRLRLLGTAASWAARGFDCDASRSVAALCTGLPATVREQLIDPLCVAALNTPAHEASARVFLRVLGDALFGGPGSSDLLLPRAGLSELLADPARRWFETSDVDVHTGQRVRELVSGRGGWVLDGQAFDAVVLACSAAEAARLAADAAPGWATQAQALRYEPIVTVYLRSRGTRLPAPMVTLGADRQSPAQFAFDLGAIGHADGVFAFVVSGARDWVERGLDACADAVMAQARDAFASSWHEAPTRLHVAAEKRATFRCTPGLQRPPARVAPGLFAAGDYVEGPYPATLEGAVRSGAAAAAALAQHDCG
jgi:squalene-associated FAD-dependent desaturase